MSAIYEFSGLPGDTFDIDLDAVVKTLPAQGPLSGSFKLQLDVFTCPMRLFNGKLHSNKIGIGMSMKDIKLPLVSVSGKDVNDSYDTPIDIQQISPSSLLAYLGLRGIGIPATNGENITRKINGVPYLSMFEIYKNYYANKQEGIGAILHTIAPNTYTFKKIRIEGYDGGGLVGSFEYDLSSTNGIVNWQDWTGNATYLKLHVWTVS